MSHLAPYRRHSASCPHRDKGADYNRCRCPVWACGQINGEKIQESLRTRDWRRAERICERREKSPDKFTTGRTIQQCVATYLKDCKSRNLREPTLKSYGKTLEHLSAFCGATRHIEHIDLEMLTDFRASREEVTVTTSRKELEHVRSFCAFAVKHKWMEANYGLEVKPPTGETVETLPFSTEEVNSIIDACGRLDNPNPRAIPRARARALAVVYLMLYSGLRISDVAELRRDGVDLKTGKLLLRVTKTGRKQYIRLGRPAIAALKEYQPESKEYIFWNGRCALGTVTRSIRRTIYRVCKLACAENAHPHRFRDTFSVRLLELGEDIRTVQLLLGHASVKTTEKYYAPWVESFQARLDAATAKLDFGVDAKLDTRLPYAV